MTAPVSAPELLIASRFCVAAVNPVLVETRETIEPKLAGDATALDPLNVMVIIEPVVRVLFVTVMPAVVVFVSANVHAGPVWLRALGRKSVRALVTTVLIPYVEA